MIDANASDADKAKELIRLRDDLLDAEATYCKALKELYPLQSFVRWYEHPYFKTGSVVGYTLAGTSLLVHESGNGRHPVHPYAIIRAVEKTKEDSGLV